MTPHEILDFMDEVYCKHIDLNDSLSVSIVKRWDSVKEFVNTLDLNKQYALVGIET